MSRLLLLLPVLWGPAVRAQQSGDREVFLYDEIDQKPRMLKGGTFFYPQHSDSAPGKVILMMVVNPDGRVDRASIKVLKAPDSSFAAAAKAIVGAATYRPGRVRGLTIRVLMQQEIGFKPTGVPCDSITTYEGHRLCTVPIPRRPD